jgi:hypothetical protein
MPFSNDKIIVLKNHAPYVVFLFYLNYLAKLLLSSDINALDLSCYIDKLEATIS